MREVSPFPVSNFYGVTHGLPFLGGFNRPVQQFVDIDGDEDFDIFVRDGGDNLRFYENVGSPEVPSYQWATDSYQDLLVGTWFRFVDGDGDGDQDLFADNPVSIARYYKNVGSISSPIFTIGVDSLHDATGSVVFVEVPTIPDWNDIDCDGDADMFLGRLSGEISHYRHIGVDQDSIPVFELVTDTFQGLIILTGGDDCFLAEVQHDSPAGHGANGMTFADVDGDMDPDLFWGDFFAQSLLYMENTGTCETPAISLTLEQYPDGNPVCTGGFNIPSFCDTDNDGDLDLYVATQGGAYSLTRDLSDNFHYFEAAGNQEYTLRSKRFLNGIDIGEKCVAALADIDGDSDPDLLLGNEAEPMNDASSRLHLYMNNGSTTEPAFACVDTNYLAPELGYNYAPTFVDIDDDADLDLILGEWSGNLNLFRNDGSVTSPLFVLVDEDYAGIDVGNNSIPAFTDIDDDGDVDLFIGEFLGTVNFYLNTGTAESAVFELDTTDYFGIDVGTYSALTFFDPDNDGDKDLLVGSDDQGVLLYRNQGTPSSPVFVYDSLASLRGQRRTAPVAADVDGDADPDLMVGVEGGGLVFYRAQEIASVAGGDEILPTTIISARNYPNPFNPETTIAVDLTRHARVRIEIADVLGRVVEEVFDGSLGQGTHRIRWDAGGKASGVYFCTVRADQEIAILKLAVIH